MQTELNTSSISVNDGRYEPTPAADDVDPLRLENFDNTACMVRLSENGANFYYLDDVMRLLERDHSNPITRGIIGLQDIRPVLTSDNGPAYLRTVVRLVNKGWTGMNEVAMFDAAQQNPDTADGLEALLAPLRNQLARTRAYFAVMAEFMRSRPAMDDKTRASIAVWRAYDLKDKSISETARAAIELRHKRNSLPTRTAITTIEEAADYFVGMHEHLLSSHVNVTLSRETTIDAFLSVLPLATSYKVKTPTREEAAKLLDARFIAAVTPRLALTRYYIINPASVGSHLCHHVLPRLTELERHTLQASWNTPHVVWRLIRTVMDRALHAFREYTPTEIATSIVRDADDFFLFESRPQRLRMHDCCHLSPYLDPHGADIPFHSSKAPNPLTIILEVCVCRTEMLPLWGEHMLLPARGGDASWLMSE